MLKGMNLTRPSIAELAAAELIVDTIPSVDMVKFTKTGSTAVTAAVKLARGFTGRHKILVCRQHPFFSFDDWFIGSTAVSKGIPENYREDVVNFDYGDIEGLRRLLAENSGGIAAVLMEPSTDVGPNEGEDSFRPSSENFLTAVQAECSARGALLILDEMITGFRLGFPGAQARFGVTPDLTTFGKAIANGFPLAFVGGRREIMEQGGIDTPGQERLFLLSTTHGAETASLGAMSSTLRQIREKKVTEYLEDYGTRLIEQSNSMASAHELESNIRFFGSGASPYFSVKGEDGENNLPLRTLFAQEMAANGVLMPWVALSRSHGPREMKKTLEAMDKSMAVVRRAISHGVENFLNGPAIKPVFRKYN
jgi:glutamate-1-semialdehyde 2,1-aminomutase